MGTRQNDFTLQTVEFSNWLWSRWKPKHTKKILNTAARWVFVGRPGLVSLPPSLVPPLLLCLPDMLWWRDKLKVILREQRLRWGMCGMTRSRSASVSEFCLTSYGPVSSPRPIWDDKGETPVDTSNQWWWTNVNWSHYDRCKTAKMFIKWHEEN